MPRPEDDGLVNVRCCYCGWLWYRKAPERATVMHEIKCRRCDRTVKYTVEGKTVRDLAAVELG